MGEKPAILTIAPVGSRELLLKVAASIQFQKSKRLRDLLLYLGEHSLQDPARILHEQEIGVDLFGRQPDYDTSHDTLVRVQVSQLRKKLQDFFLTEGRDEPMIIEIPKGSYLPVFIPRAVAYPEPEPASAQPPSFLRPFLAGIVLGLVCLALIWVVSARTKSLAAGSKQSIVDAFWKQLFANGQPTYVVLSDVTLLDFQNLMGRPVPISEYETHEFDRLATQYIADPVQRDLAKEFVTRVTTSLSDVQLAREFSALATRDSLSLDILSARDLSSSVLASANTIILGSRRANPWVGLFEDRLAFQSSYQEKPSAMRFINRSPLGSEPEEFAAEWRRNGYCRVTFLPNPTHTGNILLITGSDVISTEAGGRYVTSEESLKQLRQKLGVAANAPIPQFEVLLQTQVVNNTVPWFEMIAYRPH